jgi:hypothetical protein
MAENMQQLSALQQKLITLALDPAAQPGEISNAAVKLVESWRKEGKRLEDIFGDNQTAIAQYVNWAPDYGLCVLNFGKHKGKEFKDIPPSYLRWLKEEKEKGLAESKYPDADRRLIHEIECFLKQY